MNKTTITRAEYLQLIGLRAVWQRLDALQAEALKTACDITDERNERTGGYETAGHTYDHLSSRTDELDVTLHRLGITVAEGGPTP